MHESEQGLEQWQIMSDIPNPLLDRLNRMAFELCEQVAGNCYRLDVVASTVAGANVLDFAINRTGTISAGLKLAEICMSGLARVDICQSAHSDLPLPSIEVATDFPVESCIASQYAGWAFSLDKFFAMCSGPARMLRGKEDILTALRLESNADLAVGILETNQLPGEAEIEKFAEACSVSPTGVTLCIARTASFPGTIQVVARSVETTLHKLHELKFDLWSIRNAFGSAPLPPIGGDDLTSLGWTNDAILYGGQVNLYVETDDEKIEAIGADLPSCSSPDFGEPFLNIFERYERDFYKIDKRLFSPAHVIINNIKTGHTFSFGSVRTDILKTSFGI